MNEGTDSIRQPPVLTNWWVAVLCVLLCSPLAEAEVGYELQAALLLSDASPPLRWAPVRVELRNLTNSDVDGSVTVRSIHQPRTEFAAEVIVPARSRRQVTLLVNLEQPPSSAENSGMPAVALVEWHGRSGARLARCDLLASAPTDDSTGLASVARAGKLILAVASPTDAQPPALDELCLAIGELMRLPISSSVVEPTRLPRLSGGYDAALAVVMTGDNFDSLDPAQQDALMAFVTTGGTVICSAPSPQDVAASPWLQQHLPVIVIGERVVDELQLDFPDDSVWILKRQVRATEALPNDGQRLLANRHYVHAASRSVGLGSIVFLSVPLDSLDWSVPEIAQWGRELLGEHLMHGHAELTHLGGERTHVLESLIGTPAASWLSAAVVTGGYIAACALLFATFRGVGRPQAFQWSALVALALAGGLAVASRTRSGDGGVVGGNLTVLRLGVDGGGVRSESMAFLGRNEPSFALSADQNTMLQARVNSSSERVRLLTDPPRAPAAAIRETRVDRVWQADSVANVFEALSVELQFTEAEAELTINNGLTTTVVAPQLVVNGWAFPLPDLPKGETRLKLPQANARGDFLHTRVVGGTDTALRARVVRAASTASAEAAVTEFAASRPVIVGWLTEGGPTQSSVSTSINAAKMNNRTLLVAPVVVSPLEGDRTAKIAPEFIAIAAAGESGLPFDQATGEWLSSTLTGTFALAFQLPQGTGPIAQAQGRLRVRLQCPDHVLSLRARGDTAPATVLRQVVGRREMELPFDTHARDNSGRIWLEIQVDPTGAESFSMPSWRIEDLSVEFTVTTSN